MSLRRIIATIIAVLAALVCLLLILTAFTWPIRWWNHL